ncbi:MAG: Obg family GTPase CgtA, partial [Chloroflexota bacterium]
FLRHIERTRVLIHLLDGLSEDPLQDMVMINEELALYNPLLAEKPQIVALSKVDLPDVAELEPLLREEITKAGFEFHAISAVTGQGVRPLLFAVKQMLDAAPQPQPLVPSGEPVIIRPELEADGFTITREGDAWRVSGKEIERIATMTYFEFGGALLRFQKVLERLGITEALTDAGVQVGDTVYIGDEELEWGE